MRHYLDSIAAVLALVLAAAVLAATVAGNDYARAFAAEARGYKAWFGAEQQDRGAPAARLDNALLARNEASR